MRRLLARPAVYRAWQTPYGRRKVEPVIRALGGNRQLRVLDVGCGPATHAEAFSGTDYLGVDMSSEYVSYARQHHPDKRFEVMDVTRDSLDLGGHFDVIHVNSLLHHLDDAGADRLLGALPPLLTPEGRLHIVDLYLPRHAGVALALTRADRGDHPRTLNDLRSLVAAHAEVIALTPFALGSFGITLWHMAHLVARRSREHPDG